MAVSRLDLGDGLTGDSPATLDFRGFGIDLERIEVALRRCPGVREVWVSVSHEAPDEPHLVAHVVAAATDGPTLRQLQLAVWEELPGYAWPAAMVVESASPDDSAVTTWDALGPKTPEVSCLASLWAEVAGPGTPASPWATSRSRGTGPSPPWPPIWPSSAAWPEHRNPIIALLQALWLLCRRLVVERASTLDVLRS